MIPVEVMGTQLAILFRQLHGVIFSGGGDVDPAAYNESVTVDNLSDIQEPRDEQEIQLIHMAVEERKPFFAICRGIQVMNVARGGSLWQDVATQHPRPIRHDYYYSNDGYPRDYIAHEVTVEKSSLLSKIVGADRVGVNSLHHQGIKKVSDSLRVVGYADDGLIEALEVVDHPFGLGVQWHPEELIDRQESARKLFAAFVEAAKNGKLDSS